MRVRVTLRGCDDDASAELDVTVLDDPIALLHRLQEVFGTNVNARRCAPGFIVEELP